MELRICAVVGVVLAAGYALAGCGGSAGAAQTRAATSAVESVEELPQGTRHMAQPPVQREPLRPRSVVLVGPGAVEGYLVRCLGFAVGVAVLSAVPLGADPLTDAIRGKDVAAVEAALDAGADLETRDRRGRTLLHVALSRRAWDVAAMLLERGADVDARSQGGRTPLHQIAGNPEAVEAARLLVEYGADVNARDERGRTPLMLSVPIHTSPMPMWEALTDLGADLSLRDAEGLTAMHIAAAWGPLDAVKLLMERGASVTEADDEGRTPLHGVTHGDASAKVAFLLGHGADIHARDREGATPLHAAVSGHFPRDDTARALLEHGADPNARDHAGRTPLDVHMYGEGGIHASILELLLAHRATGTTLHAAALAGDLGKTLKLVEEGADPSARDERNWTPLHWLSFGKKANIDVARALFEAGADANARAGQYTGTPLHSNIASPEIVALLLQHGADPALSTEDGVTPLHAVAGTEHVDVARMLIDAGADVNAADSRGSTPLDGTCCCQELAVIRLLLEHGADPNKGTPLVEAAGNDNLDVVRLLLQYGADASRGAPILAAAERGDVDLVKLLVERGANPLVRGGWRNDSLLHAAVMSREMAMVELALDYRAGVDARDSDGRTALQRALRHGGIGGDVWNLLVDSGANVLATDNEGLTAPDWAVIIWGTDLPNDLRGRAASRNIHMAALHGDIERVREFLGQDVSPNARHPRDGKTPLHWAAWTKQTEVARLLIERGAQVDSREDNGSTPLYRACQRRGKVWAFDAEFARLLLLNGADPYAKNRRGRTPISNVGDYSDYQELLQSRGKAGG